LYYRWQMQYAEAHEDTCIYLRLPRELKADLEREARLRDEPVSSLLNLAAHEWLPALLTKLTNLLQTDPSLRVRLPTVPPPTANRARSSP
jgi:hypothetical protein